MRISFETDERPALITKFGLDEKASDEDIAAAFAEWANDENPVNARAEDPPPNNNGGGNDDPPPNNNNRAEAANNNGGERTQDTPDEERDDVVVLDISAYQSLEARAKRTEHLEEEARLKERTDLIEGAIKDGKFGKGRKEHYEARFDSDPEDTKRIIGMMRKGVVPVDERGTDVDNEEVDTDAYPHEWVPEVHANQTNNNGDGKQKRRSRVTSEE